MKCVAMSTGMNYKKGADIRQLKKSDILFTHSSAAATESQAKSYFRERACWGFSPQRKTKIDQDGNGPFYSTRFSAEGFWPNNQVSGHT